jgi:tetratricopeptide (TPR) repeat protein/DNA-binding XRE family transcriptional regulator
MTAAQPSAFGRLLRQQRQAAGLTQEQLAECAGVGSATIRALEAGSNLVPRRETLDLLVAALAAARQLAPAERTTLSATFAAAVRTARVATTQVPTSGSAPAPSLVGRTQELALLARHLTGAGPPCLLLAGEPGIGKSRLLQEVATRAVQAGWQVLEGGCQRRGGQEPYAPILEALQAHLRRQTRRQLQSALEDCAWLVRLLPDLAPGTLTAPTWSLSPEQERRLMFEAVGRYLANCAGPAGTLLVLDDLQWAGADALDLLGWLLRSKSTPVRVVAAYRDTEVSPQTPLGALLADLAHASLATHCRLSPLADHEARQLLRELLVDWEDEARSVLEQQVVQRMGAVPFFLVSCARGMESNRTAHLEETPLPWNVEQSIRQRVAVLPGEAQELLGVAAVTGRVVPHLVLLAAAELAEQVVLAGLDAARRARLLEECGADAYRFVHDVIREVVEADLGMARRAVLHRRVAEALEGQPGRWPIELLAFHFARSNAQEKAAAYLEQSGDEALAAHAYAAAVAHYQDGVDRLIGLGRTLAAARVREKLAEALGRTARVDDALLLLEQAAESYRRAGELEGLGRVAAHIGDMHAQAGTPEQGIHLLQPLLQLLEASGPSPGLAALYLALSELYNYSGRYRERLEAAERVVDVARAVQDDRLTAVALAVRGSSLETTGRLDEGLQALQQAVRVIETSADLDEPGARLGAVGEHLSAPGHLARQVPWLTRYEPALIMADLAYALSFKGRLQESMRFADRAAGLAARRGDPRHIAWTVSQQAIPRFFRGDWAEAQAHAERSVALYRQFGLPSRFGGGIAVRGIVLAYAGAWPEAARDLQEAIALAEQGGDLSIVRPCQGVLAEIDLGQGQPAAARARLLPLLDRPDLEEEQVTTFVLPRLALATLELGEVAEASDLAEAAVRRARALGSPLMLADALRAQALVAIRQRRWAAAQRVLDEGLVAARSVPYPYAEARLLHAYGQMHADQAESQLARARLEAAGAIFRRLGARKDVERTEHFLATLA